MLIDNKTIFSRVSNIRNLWQMDFLELEKFADFVKSRGFHSFNKDTLKILWKLGLFRADFVHSRRKLTLKGINYIGKNENGWYIYSDSRSIAKRNRLVDIPQRAMVVQPWIELHFHPFRYYLVTHFARILEFKLHPLQLALSSKGSHNVVERAIKRYTNFLRTNPIIYDRIEYWHGIADLAIATEPCVYGKIFHVIRHKGDISFSKHSSTIDSYWRLISPYYASMSKDLMDKYRGEVCIAAESLSHNKSVNILLRMMNGHNRLELEGEIGGAVYLHTMAEVLRRGYERATGKELREEDELGFGYMPPDLKKTLYGSKRILDDRRATHFFLQQLGLGYGTSVHWYVEGETEAGALKRIFPDSNAITIINLRGRVAEKKILAFRESLEHDIESGIFSMVSIDGDRQDHIRAVRSAAKDDCICGMFFIAEPDFEFCNFSKSELVEILATHAERSGSTILDRDKILKMARDCSNGKQLFLLFQREARVQGGVHKGEEWGTLLGEFALKHPHFKGTKELRPFMAAIHIAVRSVGLNYNNTRRRMMVDSDTGKLIPRTAK
jgi:hypothetical protein